jgi:PPK2 family polyphosphate:nucleotide phosphotransferase
MKLKNCPENCRVKVGTKVKLKQWPTRFEPLVDSKQEYQEKQSEHIHTLRELQNLLYADQRYALLLVFQGMDASGKDGAIKHVMSGVNPQGCQVSSFKQPSAEERAHDFLWRTTCRMPIRGQIGIFNRSYYEEVLITRVHPEVVSHQQLPEEILDGKHFWDHRYESIVNMEKHLRRNGTVILKFFLHLSKEEQRQRFLARIDEPAKNWKFSQADVQERHFWKDYQRAFEDCLSATSTDEAPWYVIPADDKQNAHLIMSQTIEDALKALPLKFPQPDKTRKEELKAIRKLLA